MRVPVRQRGVLLSAKVFPEMRDRIAGKDPVDRAAARADETAVAEEAVTPPVRAPPARLGEARRRAQRLGLPQGFAAGPRRVGFSVFSDSNTSLSSFILLSSFQTFSKPSRTFTMQVMPSGLGGAFTWTNVCCRISGSGYTFSITCGDSCSCGGCSATGYLEYEGYRLPAYGGFCGCGDNPGDDQDPDKDPPLPGAAARTTSSSRRRSRRTRRTGLRQPSTRRRRSKWN